MGSYQCSEHDKLVMAKEYIQVALKLYSEEKNLYAVLHLAGAADEILGDKLQSLGKSNSLQDLAKAWQYLKNTWAKI